MVKTVTDLLTTIFFVALAAFLVRNGNKTAGVIKASTGGLVSTIKAVTFQ